MSITKEQIYATADTLNKEGIKPTLAAVRRRLGSGSFTTISEAVNEWKLMQHSTVEMPQEAIPRVIEEHLHRFGTMLWTEAINTANGRFSQEHQAMTEQFDEKETYYTELERLVADYDNELEGAKACIEGLRDEAERTNKILNSKEEERTKLQHDLNREQFENKLLLQNNAELKQELAHANKVIDKLQANLTSLISGFDTIEKKFGTKANPKIAKNSVTVHDSN